MAAATKIEWADHTFNPWMGCTKISDACANCYAEKLVNRFGGDFATRQRTSPANWSMPLRWNARAMKDGTRPLVFCASLADVFDNQVAPEWRQDLWNLIRSTTHLDWLLLTKRPQNIAKMLPADWGDGWPNVWLGTTVENQTEADRRIPHLLAVPAAVRFLSCEPLLGPVDLTRIDPGIFAASANALNGQWKWQGGPTRKETTAVDWVICGGESGPGARPMHPDWARSLRDQCVAAGVPFLFKQWGEWGKAMPRPSGTPGKYAFATAAHHPLDARIAQIDFYPRQFDLFGGATVRERVGKKNAGRLLDGFTWDQFPKAGAA